MALSLVKPPHAEAAERELIRTMMARDDWFADVGDLLTADDFYIEANAIMWRAIAEFRKVGKAVTEVSLCAYLRTLTPFEAAFFGNDGVAAYVADLVGDPAPQDSLETLCRQIREAKMLRRLIGTAGEIQHNAHGKVTDVAAFASNAAQAVAEIATSAAPVGGPVHVAAGVKRLYDRVCAAAERDDGLTGLTSGFPELDRVTAGFQPGQLIILAARPSMGKTTLLLDWMTNAAELTGRTPLFFSLETSEDDVQLRLASSRSRIESSRIASGRLRDSEWSGFTNALSWVRSLPLHIDDRSGLTVPEMRAASRRLAVSLPTEHPLGIIGVDYLQIAKSTRRHGDRRDLEIGEVTQGLKDLAKELKVPVVALSQLSRKCDEREDKRPQLADLRESGAIEQIADVVIFIYRDVVYHPSTETPTMAEILFRKNRNGPTCDKRLAFVKEFTRFESWSEAYAMPRSGDSDDRRARASGDYDRGEM